MEIDTLLIESHSKDFANSEVLSKFFSKCSAGRSLNSGIVQDFKLSPK